MTKTIPLPTIYVASAGCGKSFTLLQNLEEALRTTTPEQVIFTTFTNAGAQEIAHRAAQKFPQYKEHQFRYFRTLHSIAYRNIPRLNMMAFGDYVQLSRDLGMPLNAKRAFGSSDGHVTQEFSKGDHLLHLDSLARNRRESWADITRLQEISSFSADEIQDFSTKYRAFRRRIQKYDFTDQLETFLNSIQGFQAPISHLFIDEAQDLSNLQWEIVHKLQERAEHTVIAGDDKQAIYAFNGGDPRTLIHLEGNRQVLDTSYRLPSRILEFADKIASKISEKQEYTCKSNKGLGEVKWIARIQELARELEEGSWFILVRNRKFMGMMEAALNDLGVLYQSDSGSSPLDGRILEAIAAWKELIRGYAIDAGILKYIYQNYLRGTDTVARGFKQALYRLDDDESVDLTQMKEEFGLLTKLPWDQCFSVSDIVRTILTKAEAAGTLGTVPRIRITTIHAVKGREADNVVLLPDLSNLTLRSYLKDPDDEHRVFYVGATRAKKKLFIHQPITKGYYRTPPC